MNDLKMMPLMGIDNVRDDAMLMSGGDGPAVWLRDAVNVDISGEGRAVLRRGLRSVSGLRLLDLWHDDLHGDTFGRDADHHLVRVDRIAGTAERLAYAGDAPLSFIPQATRVLIATAEGLMQFNGTVATPYTITTPSAPAASVQPGGSLPAGTYLLAVAWMRGDMESATSAAAVVSVPAAGMLDVVLPLCMDASVDGVRLFMGEQNSGRLLELGTYPIATTSVPVPAASGLLGEPRFRHMDKMPSGRFLAQWQGRLMTAHRNVLRFSEPMAFHIHDPRHGFIQMPQRITFLGPVDGGIWVGQVDHVVFLAGADVREMEMQKKCSAPPVPGSAILVDGSIAKEAGGRPAVAWLARNGHVLGMPDGTLVEPQRDRVQGVTGNSGQTVEVGGKLLSILQ